MGYGLNPRRRAPFEMKVALAPCAADKPDETHDDDTDFPEFTLRLVEALKELAASGGQRAGRLVEVYNRDWPDGLRIADMTACPEGCGLELRFADDPEPLVFADWDHLGATALLMLDPRLRAAVRRQAALQ